MGGRYWFIMRTRLISTVLYSFPLSTPPYRAKCFQTGHDAVGSQNLFCAHIHALVALSHRCSHHAAQIRILAISFAYSSPAGIGAMSTIGENVQLMPSALASLADTSPHFLQRPRYPMSRRGARGIGTSFRNHELRPYLRAVGCPDGCS